MKTIVVPESFVGLLYENGAFARALRPGRHKLQRGLFDTTERHVQLMDMRERSLTIKGQEILTEDKVAIRVSLLVYFRLRNPESAAHHVASYEERIYEDVQLAARRFLASKRLDGILSDRNEISDAVKQDVSEAAAGYGVEILRADVKDLVFPGNLREIMNQVLETERKAEAQLIQARKDAEALRIKTEAADAASLQALTAEKERAAVEATIRQNQHQQALARELEEALAVRENPEILQLRRLNTLTEMASRGGKFVLGSATNDWLDDDK